MHAPATYKRHRHVPSRPDGWRVEANGAQCFRGNIPWPEPPADASFEETLGLCLLNRDEGLEITPQTSRCRWLGERMDHSWAIEGMQFLEQRAGSRP